MTDLDLESQHLLELARAARTPSAEDKARVAQRLGAALGIAAGASAASAHASAAPGAAALKAGSGAALFKWIAGSVLLATAVASYVALSPKPVARAPRASSAPSAQPAPAPAAAIAPAPEPANVLAAPEPATVEHAQHTPRRVERRRPPAQSAAVSDELALLHRAQAAWRAQDAKTALALLDEHRARYPHSLLELERDALQVLSLCELGKQDDARRLARNLLARAPHTPLRASLEQSCALK